MPFRAPTRLLAALAVTGLLVAACGGDDDPTLEGTEAPTGQTTEGALDDPTAGEQLADPNEDIEDGVYRGNGVVLPVPDGWTLDAAAAAQGVIVATPQDGMAQMTARAVDTAPAEAAGQDVDLDTLLDGIRQQIEQEPAVDEEVELAGAERAHRLTYLDIAPPQEGAPRTSATIIVAEDGQGLIGEFAFTSTAEDYSEATAELLVEQAGFDPDSEPPAAPQMPGQPGAGPPTTDPDA